MPKRRLAYRDFKKYFSNHADSEDKHTFEKSMMQDRFEEEAFDGLLKLNDQEFEKDIEYLRTSIIKKAKQTRKAGPAWFRYAATALVILSIGTLYVYIADNLEHKATLKEQFAENTEIIDSTIENTVSSNEALADVMDKDTTSRAKEELLADHQAIKKERKKNTVPAKTALQPTESIEQEIVEEDIMEEAEEKEYKSTAAPNIVIEQQSLGAAPLGELKNMDFNNIEDPKMESKYKKSGMTAARGAANEEPAKRIVNGTVLDSDNRQPVPGATVAVQNTAIGVSTDLDGNFTLEIPEDKNLSELEVSFVGMEKRLFQIANDTNLLVYLDNEETALEEIVVVGFGSAQRKNLTGSVQSIEPNGNSNAQPPKGYSKNKYIKHILGKLNYSILKDYKGVHKVAVKFTVQESGSLGSFNFTGSPSQIFNDEIKRVMLETGNWVPAKSGVLNISSEEKVVLKIKVE